MSDNDPKTPARIFGATPGGILSTDHPLNQGLRTLNDLARRPTVQGLYYNGKEVMLDGYTFVGCRFDNCTLSVSSTNIQLINCVIGESTVIQYGPETIKIVQLFNSRINWVYERAPQLAPRKNADGTITIDGTAV